MDLARLKALVPLRSLATTLVLALLAVGCTAPGRFTYSIPEQPKAATGYTAKPGWAAKRFAVAAANPLATDAGYQVLKAGGTAVDAAIAVQMVLTLVEPQSSGIGGGAFLLHWDGRQVEAYDGRETAPAAAGEALFLTDEGKPMGFFEAVVGGRAVGVPGVLRMLEMAHRQHGKLPWATLFEPAIALAEEGFPISPRLNRLLAAESHLKKDPVAAAYFYETDGTPRAVGSVLRNPELARALRRIAEEGADAFYTGSIARDIAAKVRNHKANPGLMAEADLAGYRPIKREALCSDWRAYRLCGFPPPSSGHIAIAQILGILEHAPRVATPLVEGVPSADQLHVYTEAARLAFADRAQYIADPDFVSAPAGDWSSLLDDGYLERRAALIGSQSMQTAQPGVPGALKTSYAPQPEQPEYGTSHISIVDGGGRAVAMTTTIENPFGARQMVQGFLLNNELTDFAFAPTDSAGTPVANRIQPGKRPRSSMSPTLVFDRATAQLILTTGSPGGPLIIHYTAKVLLGTLAWGLNVQQAIDLPNFGSLNGPTLLEADRFPSETVHELEFRGHQVREMEMTSGLQAIQRTTTGLFGGADPRREGIVMGE